MHLKQLKINGFKSFAESHLVDFNRGVTAIVGPNGCGKTNIIDAIRWVLGEQRPKILRAEKMEDVIFSGTIRRKPLNFTEVTLVVENDRNLIPVDDKTVHITRRIYRTGESEYLVNKKLCRLKDIHSIFFDTGMGLGSYSLIEAKMIDLILSDKDEERRVMFEEAAGISKYRNLRKEALRNLLKTADDLNRISDLTAEKERHVKMLERHVTKAQKFREYRDALKTVEVAYCAKVFGGVTEEVRAVSRLHAQYKAEQTLLSAEMSESEARRQAQKLLAARKEETVMSAGAAVSQATERIHAIEKEAATLNAKIDAGLRAGAQSLQYEKKSEEKIGHLKEAQAAAESQIISLESRVREAESTHIVSRREFDEFELALAEKKLALNRSHQDKIALMEEEAALRTAGEKLKSGAQALVENKMTAERSVDADQKRREACRERIGERRDSLSRVSKEFESLSLSRDTLVSKIDGAERRYREILEEEKNLEASLISDEKKLEFAESLRKNHEGYKQAVRSVVEKGIAGISGIVADMVEVNPQYLAAIEAALGSRVQFLLAEGDAAAREAIRFLKEGRLGAASFVVRSRLTAKLPPLPREKFETLPGVIGWADRFAAFKPGYTDLGPLLLGDVLLVESPAAVPAVKALAGEVPLYCVTADGEIHTTHGIVRGGETVREELGLLTRGRSIDTLKEAIAKTRARIDVKEGEKSAALTTLEEAKKALFGVDEKLNVGHRSRHEHEGDIRQLDEEIMRIQAKENETLEQLRHLELRLRASEEEVKGLEQALQKLEERKTEVESGGLIAADELKSLEDQRLGVGEKLKGSEFELRTTEQKLTAARSELERLSAETAEAYRALDEARETRHKGEFDMASDRARLVELAELQARETALRAEKEAQSALLREEYAQFLNGIEEIQKSVNEREKVFRGIQDKLHECELKLERLNEKRRSIQERIWEEYEVDLNSPGPAEAPLAVSDEEAQQQIDVLKKRLKVIGPNVNLGVLEDYESEKTGFDELSRQKLDLENAKTQLEKLVRKLDREASEKFVDTFNIARDNFRKVFVGLFEGGEADLRLEENDDPLQAKIAVYARPSGKSLKSISLLSGGERALTATSLLFALYLVKSSPYCILDEVDGPLDDANIGRFINLIRKFSGETQFLVITHNKKTMAACDVLYGVTLEEPGVSKMVSVSLQTEEERKKVDALIGQG